MTDLETVKRLCRTCASGTEQLGHANKCPQRALAQATQALKDAAVQWSVVANNQTILASELRHDAKNILFRAAEDYAEVYLKGGGK